MGSKKGCNGKHDFRGSERTISVLNPRTNEQGNVTILTCCKCGLHSDGSNLIRLKKVNEINRVPIYTIANIPAQIK